MKKKIIKRRRRRGKSKGTPSKLYFHEGTQEAIIKFQDSECQEEKEKIYVSEILPAFDKLVEKSIMVADTEDVACPMMITEIAAKVLSQYETPANRGADAIAAIGLEYMRNHIANLNELYNILDKSGALSLGMDDYLASAANQYEGYYYLLTQRVKRGV